MVPITSFIIRHNNFQSVGTVVDRRRLEEKARKKEAEIQALEAQIKDAKVYLQALQDVLRMFPRDVAEAVTAATSLRPGSLVAQARAVILKHRTPLHVDRILVDLKKEVNRANKTGLSGSLAAYVRKNEIFTRPSPNTFGLIELQSESCGEALPADFGLDTPRQPDMDEISPI